MINKIKSTASLIILLMIALLSSGCISEGAQAKNAVKNYNSALGKAYFTGDYMDLRKFATLEEQQKIGQKMAEMRAEGKILRSNIESLKFNNVELAGHRAALTTEEKWSYEVLDDKSGKAESPVIKTHYEVLYSVVKKEDKDGSHWLVESVTVQEEKQVK